jgi:DNA polymerase
VHELTASPLWAYREENDYHPVIGEGDLDADIMIIGEAPGKQEAETGRPFVGRAGQFLDELLASVGIERHEVYITNVVKDRPPNNRAPRVGEVAVYEPFLLQQIDTICPRVIVTLGRFAMEFIVQRLDVNEEVEGLKISDLHGQLLHAKASYGPVAVIPLYHPAASFYNRSLRDTLEQDVRILERFISEGEPGADEGEPYVL